MSLVRERRTDAGGHFTLEGVPSGRTVWLYVETEDRKFAGTTSIKAPAKADPAFRIALSLAPTVGVEWAIQDDAGKPMKSKKFHLTPKLGEGMTLVRSAGAPSSRTSRVESSSTASFPACPTISRKLCRRAKGQSLSARGTSPLV